MPVTMLTDATEGLAVYTGPYRNYNRCHIAFVENEVYKVLYNGTYDEIPRYTVYPMFAFNGQKYINIPKELRPFFRPVKVHVCKS